MNRRERLLGLLLLAILAVASGLSSRPAAEAANNDTGFPVGGTISAQGYNRDRQIAAFAPGLTVADSTTLSTVLAVTARDFHLNGRPNLTVSCRFATSATNTCKIQVVWVYNDGTTQYVLGLSANVQANATTIQDQTTNYFMAPDLFFDGHGATDAYVLLTTAPTGGGAVDLWVGSF